MLNHKRLLTMRYHETDPSKPSKKTFLDDSAQRTVYTVSSTTVIQFTPNYVDLVLSGEQPLTTPLTVPGLCRTIRLLGSAGDVLPRSIESASSAGK